MDAIAAYTGKVQRMPRAERVDLKLQVGNLGKFNLNFWEKNLFVVEAPLLAVTPPPAPFITVVISSVV